MAAIDVGHAGKLVRAMGFARNHSSGSDAPTPVRRKARRRTPPLASRECEATRPLLGQSESPLRRAISHLGTIAMTPRRVSKRERRALRARGSRCLGSSAGRRCDSRSYAWRSSMGGACGSSGRAAGSVRSVETSASRRCNCSRNWSGWYSRCARRLRASSTPVVATPARPASPISFQRARIGSVGY